MDKYIEYEYTVDEEMPDCGCCDHVCDDNFNCTEWCGAEHAWYGYRRTERITYDDIIRDYRIKTKEI